jgi:Ser/Thr protein kinase RdoA (MazF antagonist)
VLAPESLSIVRGAELDDGRTVVLKARPVGQERRAASCVAVQRELAEQGFPCAPPLTGVSLVADRAVNAEEWRPGGEMMRDATEAAARRSAALLADLMARLERLSDEPPLPNPEWVRWDHEGPGLFPANPFHDPRAAVTTLPEVILETARRARDRLRRAALDSVLGHADWEAQNLRWQGDRPHVVYDWDSLAGLPEAAVVGAAAGAFASTEVPTLAPVASSEAFLDGYAQARGRAFSTEELEVAWAASLWPALHNARGEVLWAQPPVALAALEAQAETRLGLAGA